MASPYVGVATPVLAPVVGVGTTAGWSGSTGAPKKSQAHGGAIAAAVVAGLAVLAGAGLVAFKYARPHDASGESAGGSSSTAAPTASASTPLPAPTLITTTAPPASATAVATASAAPTTRAAGFAPPATPQRPNPLLVPANAKKGPPSAANAPPAGAPPTTAAPPPPAPKSGGGILDTSN